MKLLSTKIAIVIPVLALLFCSLASVNAQVVKDELSEREGVSVEEHLGDQIPLDLEFTDSRGKQVRLSDFFEKDKPVLLSLVYYDCPMLCTLVLNGMTNALKQVDWTPGEEFTMLTISIDERETAKLASDKKYRYDETLERKSGEDAWEFLVGKAENSKLLAETIGFHYKYDEKSNQFLHPASIFILTPEGKISRYLYNIEFKPQDLKFGLMEASEGRLTNTFEKLLLYCFHYDPNSKGYVLFAANLMKLGGAITLLFIVMFLVTMWTKERLRSKAA